MSDWIDETVDTEKMREARETLHDGILDIYDRYIAGGYSKEEVLLMLPGMVPESSRYLLPLLMYWITTERP